MTPITRDAQGNAVFHPYQRPGDGFEAADAKLIGELDSTYISAKKIVNPPVQPSREKLVITTPNADYLPRINLGHQVISMCEDGRWGAEDWAQWPQWYFDGQEHFPYILRKPPPEIFSKHPLRRLWWNMTEDYWVVSDPEKRVGLLLPRIAQELYDIRTSIMQEVDACRCEHGADYTQMQESARMMRNCTASLRYTPQPFFEVVLLVTASQRYCLETKAIVDKVTKWDKLLAPRVQRPADNTILGCITDRLPILYDMFEKGIPVWFVRPSYQLHSTITIIAQRSVTHPQRAGIITKRWPNTPIFYQGPLDREIHASIERWKPGNLDLRLLERIKTVGSQEQEGSTQTPKAQRGLVPYSKTDAIARVSTKKLQITINHDLFDESPSLFSSEAPKVWKDALHSVKCDTSRVITHPQLHLFRGFALPPRRLFTKENDTLSIALSLAWLAARPSWLQEIGNPNRTSPLPFAQQWRHFLHDLSLSLELTRNDIRTVYPPSSGQLSRKSNLKTAGKEIFSFVSLTKENVTSISWNSHIVWQKSNYKVSELTSLDRKLLAWDIQDHNFRLKLFTLDRCVLVDVWKTTEGRAHREALHNAMWPNDIILMTALPSGDSGITARDWKTRGRFVQAFQRILVDWPGDVPSELAKILFHFNSGGRDVWHQLNMEKTEKLASRFYCQTFFDHFGRAPCIPHFFPVA